MKPKSKFQAHLAELSKAIPTITNTQKSWAYKHLFQHIAHRTKKGTTTCLECGHAWTDQEPTAATTTCPHCETKLTVTTTRQRVFKQTEYLCTVTTFQGFQVLRFCYIDVYRKVGQPAHYFCKEVVQRWITPNGKFATLALLRPMCCWQDTWQWSSNLELRPEKELYDIMPSAVYPRMKVLPEIKRNGFKGEFHHLTPFEMLHTILTDNKAETLLKAGQTNILRHFVRAGHSKMDDFWASIRICNRAGYTIEDGSMWCDYIRLLQFFGKDTTNAKYVCPDNLKMQHDTLVKKKEQHQERQQLEEQRKKILADEERFQELKAKFFGVTFTDGTIQVRILESVQEYFDEGKFMKHCVSTSTYHLRPESLILSATIDGKRVETVEFSLRTLNVVQSRGTYNQITEYHDQIINLVNKNKRLIRQRMVA